MDEMARGVGAVERCPLRYRAVLRLFLRSWGHDSNATPVPGRGTLARSSEMIGLVERQTEFLEALLARDSARARRAVEDALAQGVPVPDIYLGMLQPAMREVGTGGRSATSTSPRSTTPPPWPTRSSTG